MKQLRQKENHYSGTRAQAMSAREHKNRAIARRAAAESIVLLQNDGVLPLTPAANIALFGCGSLHFVKGGTGSGDVNERELVSLYAGMKAAGFSVANEAWIPDYEADYAQAHAAWAARIQQAARDNAHSPYAMMSVYVRDKFLPPLGRMVTDAEVTAMHTDTAVYVISRNAGEGADRTAEPGDYFVTDAEFAQMQALNQQFPRMILVLNCGGPIDLGFVQKLSISALVQLSQPGMEGGNAFADVASGAVCPCGKLTDTWAANYNDYPNATTFSHCNGNVQAEQYHEGIYVGYRYFDTFGITPQFPFGFGLSYTQFSMHMTEMTVMQTDDTNQLITGIRIAVQVENTGTTYAGKQIVQLYASCPQGALTKEYQRLCAFAKTPLLQPGERCVLSLTISLDALASFSEAECAYLLEKGDYSIALGGSSACNSVVAIVRMPTTTALLRVKHVCPLQQPLAELQPKHPRERVCENAPVLLLSADQIATRTATYPTSTLGRLSHTARAFADTLTEAQLLALTSGDPGKGQDSAETFGSSGLRVPGAAGETHNCATTAPHNLASIVLADGPAGLRLAHAYQVTPQGNIVKPGFTDTIEHGLFSQQKEVPGASVYYQYCTAFPVGTMLAQSWDVDLLRTVGAAVATEMQEFGVSLWLAPGMNIHRNPLCGRNFEYLSEDPLLTGMLAAAITQGVQACPGVGTTIKHFACNNQEDNRKHSDSIVSERALREIYLRGFALTIQQAQPMAIMTSYNLLNGVHTANSYDLITNVARGEWGFAGVVMTDWTTTGEGGASPVGCLTAGNDLIMPGSAQDIAQIREALHGLSEETLTLEEIKNCVANLIHIIWASCAYEKSTSYTASAL